MKRTQRLLKISLIKFFRWFKGFFEEGTPQSMMRLLAFLVTFNGCLLAWFFRDYETLILGFITLGLTGKAAQKHIEKIPKANGEKENGGAKLK